MEKVGNMAAMVLSGNRAQARQIDAGAPEAARLVSSPPQAAETGRMGETERQSVAHSERQRYDQEAAQLPEHVRQFCALIQTKFASQKDGQPFDRHDLRAYGRQVAALTPDQTRDVFDRLRELHKWRPDVPDVVAVVEDLFGATRPARIPGAEADARRIVSLKADLERFERDQARALPGSVAQGWGRQYARDQVAQRAASLTPEDLEYAAALRRARKRRQGSRRSSEAPPRRRP